MFVFHTSKDTTSVVRGYLAFIKPLAVCAAVKQEVQMNEQLEQEVTDLLRQNRKLDAVIRTREVTGLGLAESLQWVEQMAAPLAAMGPKTKVVRQLSLASRIMRQVAVVAVVAVLALLPTCATMGFAPVGTRLAAPLVCPSGTARTEVVSRWVGNSNGGNSLEFDLYCLTSDGFGSVSSTPKLFFGVLGVWSAIVLVLALLRRGIGFLSARRRREGQGHAA